MDGFQERRTGQKERESERESEFQHIVPALMKALSFLLPNLARSKVPFLSKSRRRFPYVTCEF